MTTQIKSGVIAANAITGTQIAANAINATHLAAGIVVASDIADNSITSAKIAKNAVDSAELVSGSIDTVHIADSQVTNVKLANSSVTVNSNAVSLGSSITLDTDDIGEGSTNQYFTNARAQGAITVTDAGGDGSLGYSSGTITYTGPSAAETRAHFSAGTGVTLSSGQISIGQDVGTTATPTFGNITTTGYLAGPATFTIDPAAVGDNTGTVVIAGNLQVDGTTTTINSTTMTVDDLNITLASGAANAAAANGAGITVDTANATITYNGTTDSWEFNKEIVLPNNVGLFFDNAAATAVLGIKANTSDEITFRTGGNWDRLVIDGSGNATFAGTITSGDIEISDTTPALLLMESDTTDVNARLWNNGGDFFLSTINDAKSLVTNRFSLDHATGDIAFYEDTGTTAKLFWDASAESLGIGTTSPATALEVKGDGSVIQVSSADYDVALLGRRGSSGVDLDKGYLRLRDTGVTKVAIDSAGNSYFNGGNVGIGTSSPTFTSGGGLEIYNAGQANLRLSSTTNNTDFAQSGADTYIINRVTSGDIKFRVNGSTELITIDGGTGSVGISNSQPSSTYKLDVSGAIRSTTTAPSFNLQETDALNQHWALGSYAGVFALRDVTGSTYPLQIEQAVPTNTLYLDSTGNVGIGTNSPQDTLHVVTDSSTTNDTVDVARIEATSTGTPLVGFGPTIDFRGERGSASSDSMGRIGFVADVMTASRIDGAFVVETAIDGVYSERMRISSAGNVGIGTNNPTGAKLHVTGGIKATDLIAHDTTGINLQTSNGTKRLVVDNSGNVGIGETSPITPLHVKMATGKNILFQDALSSAAIKFTTDAGAGYAAGTINASSLAINADSGGNVGIGTNSPTHALDVRGGDITIYGGADGYNASGERVRLYVGNNNAHIGAEYDRGLFISAGNSAPEVHIRQATGNVGIGTNAPSQKLQVNGHALLLGTGSGTFTTGGDEAICYLGDTNNYIKGVNGSRTVVNGYHGCSLNGLGNERLAVHGDKTEVLINRSSTFGAGSSAALIVTGGSAQGIRVTGPNTSGYQWIGFFNGGLGQIGSISNNSNTNTSYNTSSDYRLKQNVNDNWDATSILKQLRPVEFTWIADETDEVHQGFLAHEVQEHLPFAVTGEKDAVQDPMDDGEGGTIPGSEIKGQEMDYAKVVPLLVKTIQELEARITELENA